jgi:hypothetical protein
MTMPDVIPPLSDEQRQHIYDEERLRRASATPVSRLAAMSSRGQLVVGTAMLLITVGATVLVTRAIADPSHEQAGWMPHDEELLASDEMPAGAPSRMRGDDGSRSGPRFADVEGDPNKFSGTKILWRGRVRGIITPQDSGGIGFFVEDPETERSFIARWYTAPSDHAIKDGVWVAVSGTITGTFEGKNNFGGPFTAPDTDADRVAIITRAQAIAPAARTIEIGKQDTQNGLTITVQKIELARVETRVYVRLQNDDSGKMTLFKGNTKLIQGKKQLEPRIVFDAEDEQPQDEVLPGAETEGYIVFPPIESEPKALRLFMGEPYSSNHHEFRDFDFSFNL